MIESVQTIKNDKFSETIHYIAKNQTWDKKTLKELKDKYNIIFMTSGDSICPIMIIPRENASPMIAIGSEDDGCITFQKRYNNYINSMDIFWINGLIADLTTAQKIAQKLTKKSKE